MNYKDRYMEPGFEDFIIENMDDTYLVNLKEPVKQNKHSDKIEYDQTTRETYRVVRFRKMDPITHEELDDRHAFIFKEMWNPFSGELSGPDPDGPLYCDPDYLIKYFYENRLKQLWVSESDEADGTYEEYHGDALGAGENLYVNGTEHPEWYLFRLPYIDCYLSKEHNAQFLTITPKLSQKQIEEIEDKAKLYPNRYKKMFGVSRPSLREIKKFYDIAISKNHHKENINAVKKLISMRG